MLKRILTTALFAGFAAGLVVSAVQAVWVTPLIHQAERFEQSAGSGHLQESTDSGQGGAHDHGRVNAEGAAWAPEDGLERIGFTLLANALIGVGFALLLVGAVALSGRDVNLRSGLLWGAAGFAVFGLAPAMGILPKPPGVDAGPVFERQLWWVGSALATAIGLGFLVFAKSWVTKIGGLVVIAAPHAIGAPAVDLSGSATPQQLINAFAVASLATTAVFHLALGGLTGYFYKKLS